MFQKKPSFFSPRGRSSLSASWRSGCGARFPFDLSVVSLLLYSMVHYGALFFLFPLSELFAAFCLFYDFFCTCFASKRKAELSANCRFFHDFFVMLSHSIQS